MIRWLTDEFGVTPQLMPDDIPALAGDGVTTLICNRPDAEVPPDLSAEAMRAAAEAAGLNFVFNPYTAGMPSLEQVSAQRPDLPGRTVAYCASGTRSTVLWALSEAGQRETDEILDRARGAGYALDGLRPVLETGGPR